MKLEPRYKNDPVLGDMYYCELTRYLDDVSGITEMSKYFKHYVLIDKYWEKEKVLPVRVPGGTVGGIWIDDNNIITKIDIDTKYVIKSYPENVNELMEKYIGTEIEVDE